MSPGEIAFLGMAIGALTIFAIALAYASWVAGGAAPPARQRRSGSLAQAGQFGRYTNDRETKRAA